MAEKKTLTKEERIKKYILNSTKDWAAEEFAGSKTEASEKAKNIAKSLDGIKSINAVDKKELAKTFGYVLGESIPWESDDKIKLPNMVALVLTGAFESHPYTLNAVLVHSTDGQCFNPDGSAGSWIEPPKKFVRPATPEEVENLPEKQLKGMLKESNIVIA